MKKVDLLNLLKEMPDGVEISDNTGKIVLNLTLSDCKAAQIIQWIEGTLVSDTTTVGEIELWLADALFWIKFLGALAQAQRENIKP